MGQVSLRDLVQKYSRGEIVKEEYRKVRAELISNVLAREDSLRTNTYPPLIKPSDEGTLDITERSQKKESGPSADASTAVPASDKSPATRRRPLNPLYIAGALILVIIAIIVVIALLPEHPRVQQAAVQEQPAAAPETRQAQPPEASDQARKLIDGFLQKNSWDNGSMDEFLRNWNSLQDTDRQSIKGTMVLNRLTNAIFNRLEEERAIAEIDSSSSETKADEHRQEDLVAFAHQVGIDDDRIRVQLPATQAAEQTVAQADTSSGAASNAINQVPEATATPPATTPVEAAADQAEVGESANPASTPAPAPTPEPAETAVATKPAETPIKAAPAPQETVAASDQKPKPDKQVPAAAVKPSTTQTTEAPAAVVQHKSGNCKPSLLKTRRPYCRDVIPGIGNGPTMVIIPPGKFAMGGKRPDEQPVHNVVISKPFAMSVHEITFGEYQQYCKDTHKTCPTQPWAGADYPVVNVSWSDANAYTDWLSAKTGQRYRLPSESEWEYAARGGTKTIYPFGDTIDISYAVFSERTTLSSPLPKTDRSVNRNKFRLYHIVGNVREWVEDTWVDNYKGAPDDGSPRLDGDKSMRIARGGSYDDNAEALRSAARKPLPADTTDSYTGFRIIQEID